MKNLYAAATCAAIVCVFPFIGDRWTGVAFAQKGAPIVIIQPAVPAAEVKVTQVTVDNFQTEVLDSKVPVVIDFYADWCPPCRGFAPIFEATAADYDGKVKFGRANVDDTAKLTKFFEVKSIPTVILIKKDDKGDLVYYKVVGALDKESLKKFIDDAVKGTTAGKRLPKWN